MQQRFDMQVALREATGKGAARSLRREGRIPGVLYGAGQAMSLTVDPLDLLRLMGQGGGESALINLKIQGLKGKEDLRVAILRDTQLDPLTGYFLHADFQEVSLTQAIRVWVHIEVSGAAAGVKEGGTLQQSLREIEVECLPLAIPEKLKVDVSRLNIGDMIHVRDLRAEEGVKILGHPEQPVVTVVPPISEVELQEMLAAAPGEAAEPELVGKSKEKEKEKEEAQEGAKAEGGKPKGPAAARSGE